MVIKMKINKFLFIYSLLLSNLLTANLVNLDNNENIKILKKNKSTVKLDESINILYESIAYPISENIITINEPEKIGSFYYHLNYSEEEERNLINNGYKIYKLVKTRTNKFMISDGSFIIKFKDGVDKFKFNSDYVLTPKYEIGIRTAYQSKGFHNLIDLIKSFNKDSRIIFFELDLIDPTLVLR